jgi:putative toxin-antitoxin system antitoxin component (TIGR02293 family)
MKTIDFNCLLKKAKLPLTTLEDEATYIQAVREGISGAIVQPAILELGERELFSRLLNTNISNLSRFYRQKTLSATISEAILDTLRVFKLALEVYEGDAETALLWLHTNIPALSNEIPINLLDTFEGRRMVKDCLMVMEYGDFT